MKKFFLVILVILSAVVSFLGTLYFNSRDNLSNKDRTSLNISTENMEFEGWNVDGDTYKSTDNQGSITFRNIDTYVHTLALDATMSKYNVTTKLYYTTADGEAFSEDNMYELKCNYIDGKVYYTLDEQVSDIRLVFPQNSKFEMIINSADVNPTYLTFVLTNLFVASMLSSMIVITLYLLISKRKATSKSKEVFKHYSNLLYELTKKEINLKYRRSYLGVFWSLLSPILIMIVLTVVFSTVFKNSIPNFPVYLLCGKLIFDYNSQATKQSMTSVISNSALIKKVYIPKYLFPLAKTLSAFVTLFFSLVALVVVMIATKAPFHPTLVFFWMPLIYLFVFSTGLGLILGSITVFFRDVEHLYAVVLTAWTYFTPLFYPVDIIPAKFLFFVKLNPLYYMVTMLREIVLEGVLPSMTEHLICFTVSTFTLAIGVYLFKKLQDKFILYI